MTVRDLLKSRIEIQGECKIVVYDEENNSLIDLRDHDDAWDRQINYMYVQDGVLYFEVDQ